ncbi:MAG TPA: molybdopterin molybdenumtransferase MoeA [Flavobacterium sp.]|nr:molybdopterin molybdenumtransferase MoeA [Flavobacterium sp.]
MIQVEDALLLIQQHTHKLPAKKIKVKKSLGYILSEAVYSPMDMPPFRQSAMDGYAFLYGDSTRYEVVNTIAAGHFSTIEIKKDQAVRIFTGAFVPDNLDTVVMQEHTVANGNKMEIIKMPSKFSNVRNKGEQVKINELVLQQNTPITAAAIGFLTCLGITEIAVYDKPKVGIIVTGDELVRAGEQLPKGAIYESNSVMLEAALQQMGIKKVKIYGVKDTLKATKKVIKNNLDKFDVVLVSGGISVGDYDFVKEALWSNGVEELFYKINQKPGKPLFFGKKNNTLATRRSPRPWPRLTWFRCTAR